MNEIKDLKTRRKPYGERPFGYLKLYVTDNGIADVADKFACKNGIYSLNFKSSTWDKVVRACNRIVNKIVLELIDGAEKVQYSHKCGCSCGCSPGHKVYGKGEMFHNHDGWGKLIIDEQIVENFKKRLDTEFQEHFDSVIDSERAAHELEVYEAAQRREKKEADRRAFWDRLNREREEKQMVETGYAMGI